MSDDPRDPSTEHVFAMFRLTLLNSISGSTPAVVTAYDAGKQRVSVQPMIMHAVDDESENRTAETPPPRHDVPVAFIGTARGRITFPIAAGDQCLLVQCGSSIAAWKDKGGVIDPVDDRRHDINDCVALFGLYDSGHLPTPAPSDAMVLWANELRLGEDVTAGDAWVAVQSTLDKFMQILSTVTDSAGACAALHAALVSGSWPAQWVATKVKAK